MKPIIVDFLRRWWGEYLLVALFVGAMALEFEATFQFVLFLNIPLVLETIRRPLGAMLTLPASRRTIALSYWCLAVPLPALIMTGIAVFSMLFPSSAISLKDVAMVLVCSLAFIGSVWCFFTLRVSREYAVICCLLPLLGCFVLSGVKFLEFPPQTLVAYLAIFIGLPLTVWGYLRSEKLVMGRAGKRTDSGPHRAQAYTRIPNSKPGMTRFGGVFFGIVLHGFLFGLFYSTMLLLIVKSHNDSIGFFWAYLFMFDATVSPKILLGGVRLLRSLPLSTGRLALTLLLMPIFGFLAMIVGVATLQWLNLCHILSHDSSAFLIPMAGAICIAVSFTILYSGGKGHGLAIALAGSSSMVIFATVSSMNWPSAFWWLLGLGLMVAAFFLNRHWLRSSDSYRAAPGDSLRR